MNNTFVNTDTADTAKEDCMDNVYVNTATATGSKAGEEGRRMEKKTVIGMMAVTMAAAAGAAGMAPGMGVHAAEAASPAAEAPAGFVEEAKAGADSAQAAEDAAR